MGSRVRRRAAQPGIVGAGLRGIGGFGSILAAGLGGPVGWILLLIPLVLLAMEIFGGNKNNNNNTNNNTNNNSFSGTSERNIYVSTALNHNEVVDIMNGSNAIDNSLVQVAAGGV